LTISYSPLSAIKFHSVLLHVPEIKTRYRLMDSIFFVESFGYPLLRIHSAFRTWFALLRVTCAIRLADATAAAWRMFVPEKRRGSIARSEKMSSGRMGLYRVQLRDDGEGVRAPSRRREWWTGSAAEHNVFLVTSLMATGLVRQAASGDDGTYYTWVCSMHIPCADSRVTYTFLLSRR